MAAERGLITAFFDRDRNVTGRQLFLREKKPEVDHRVEKKVKEGVPRRGCQSTVQKELWDELSESDRVVWLDRANQFNAKENGITEEDIAE